MDQLWANRINLAGLYSVVPVSMYYDDESETWWDKNGNFDIGAFAPGDGVTLLLKGITNEKNGVITFVSSDYDLVRAWTRGVQDTMRSLRLWTNTAEPATVEA